MQVQRWGLPLITHLFVRANDDLKDWFNASVPADDMALFSKPIAEFAEQMARYAGSAVNPAEYGKQIVTRLYPIMLPYELGTEAAFDQAGFNGRPLGEDVMDVMLTLASNKPLADGAAPDRSRVRSEFTKVRNSPRPSSICCPYFGEPYR